ncbi:hypothetical protein DC20_07165 [Rufibacter tibetensis]|uniref:Uncharacterized protein n=1 Tax=Rufibacter tibetensis TaxID=512763 RepID=A0A0P0CNN5_9BACT|nr:hypothetical protein DC20_07165 [Rufibacter tibetensis]
MGKNGALNALNGLFVKRMACKYFFVKFAIIFKCKIDIFVFMQGLQWSCLRICCSGKFALL